MAEIKCEICNKNFSSEEAMNQHKDAKHYSMEKHNSISTKKYFVIGALALIVVLFSYSFYARAQKPGEYDNFAKCLTEKGAIIYGNDFCQYTNKQMNYFGKSKKNLNYIKCIDNKELCDQKGIKQTPTWEINGKMYEQVQTFEKLSQLSGCGL